MAQSSIHVGKPLLVRGWPQAPEPLGATGAQTSPRCHEAEPREAIVGTRDQWGEGSLGWAQGVLAEPILRRGSIVLNGSLF